MIKALLRCLGMVKDKRTGEEADPIYGYSKRAIDDWLCNNPVLKKEHEAKLQRRRNLSKGSGMKKAADS